MLRILVLLLIFTFSFWPSYAETSLKIGVVDGEILFDEYPGVQDTQKKISDAQDALRDAIDESEKVYTEFEKQNKSEAEKLTKKKELQTKIDVKAQDTKKLIESISVKIEDDILQAIKKVALEKGLDVVFDKRAVLTGGTDVTSDVTKHLKKGAVPIANDEGNKKAN